MRILKLIFSIYDSKLNISGFNAVGQIKQLLDISLRYWELQRISTNVSKHFLDKMLVAKTLQI